MIWNLLYLEIRNFFRRIKWKIKQTICRKNFAFIIDREKIQQKAKNISGREFSKKELEQVFENMQTVFNDWQKDEMLTAITKFLLETYGNMYGIPDWQFQILSRSKRNVV